MSDTIELPKGDSLTVTFLLQDSNAAAVTFDAALLTVKGGLGATDYVLAGVPTVAGAATFTIPAHALATPNGYSAAVTATKGSTEQNTIAFTLKVTDHAG